MAILLITAMMVLLASNGVEASSRKLLETTSTCNPCPEVNPTVYVTTGNGAKPPNSLWRIPNFTPNSTTTMVPEFLCRARVATGTLTQLGDIAMMANGDIIIVDTPGSNLFYLKNASLPVGQSSNFNYSVWCTLTKFGAVTLPPNNTGGPSGLGSGYSPDALVVATSGGYVIPLNITAIGEGYAISASSSEPVIGPVTCATGGSDINASPTADGDYYRWCAAGSGVNMGTRFFTTLDRIPRLNGSSSLISANTSDTAYKNGGTFCTNSTVWAVQAAVTGRFAAMWAFGWIDNELWNLSATTLTSNTQTANVSVVSSFDTPFLVNGAAVIPTCS